MPIVVLCRITPVMVVNAQVPANSVKELVALARSKPGALNYGSYGVGTYAHLSMEDFKQRTGTDIVHVPYPWGRSGHNRPARRQISMLILNLSSIEAHEKTGKAKILSAASDKRDRCCGPTLRRLPESGVPGFATTHRGSACSRRPTRRRSSSRKIHADVSGMRSTIRRAKEFFAKNSFERVALTPQGVSQADRQRLEALGSADQVGRGKDGGVEQQQVPTCPGRGAA